MESNAFDPLALLIAVAVIAVVGFWVWHMVHQVRATGAAIVRLADRRAAQQRAAIDTQTAQGKPESLALRVAQILSLLLLTAGLGLMLLRKFGLF